MPKRTLSIVDNGTGQTYEVPVVDGTVRAKDFRSIKISPDDFGLMVYDPGFMNTASCRSKITYIDGDAGVLLYRGYPIEQLAEQIDYLQAAYLVLYGELPTDAQYQDFATEVRQSSDLPEPVYQIISRFPRHAPPMVMLESLVAALATFYPESKRVDDPEVRKRQIIRLLAETPTLAACLYRHNNGLPFVPPSPDLSFSGNFLKMMFQRPDTDYEVNPVLVRAMDVLFILHADHEQNCSTSTIRVAGSSRSDPYSAMAAAIGALSGPLHGGANEAVLRMLAEIGSVKAIPDYVRRVKQGEIRLMGFGHRVYRNYDPRAKIIKQIAEEVFRETSPNPLLPVALELEKIALEDEYFVARKLYPNVDFYSGLIYQAVGFPPEMFTVLFAVPRTSGWLAQWEEMLRDPEQKIARPRQIYEGYPRRELEKVAKPQPGVSRN